VRVVGFSPDGLHVAAGIGETGVVFDSSNGKEIKRLAVGNLIDVVALSPNARYLAAGASSDGMASVLDVVSQKEVTRLTLGRGVNSMAFSPKGNAVVAGGIDRTVQVFEPVGGREVSRLIHQAEVRALAFSPDGRYVAAGGADQTARVFEALSGNEVSRISHFGPVVAVTFTPDSRHLMTAAGDSEIVVNRHLLRPEDLIQEACLSLTRNLTREEWKQYLGDKPYHKTCARLP
jgi:WD40 repeat protein